MIAWYPLADAEPDVDIADQSGNGNDLISAYPYFTDKEPVTDYAYSFVLIGDTQYLSLVYPEKLTYIYDWLLANQEEKNIQYVFGLGDITDKSTDAEWTAAKGNIAKLDGNIPYSVVRGNHDNVDDFVSNFAYDAYLNQFEGFYEEGNPMNTWRTFTVGNVDYLLLALDFAPSDEILAWANGVVVAHPNHNVIISTHMYLSGQGTPIADNVGDTTLEGGAASDNYNNGDMIWQKLISQHENIVMAFCGHITQANIVTSRARGVHGNIVTNVMVDPHDTDANHGPAGMVAMLYFSEDGSNIDVEYYSTVKNAYFKPEYQFSLTVPVVDGEKDLMDDATVTSTASCTVEQVAVTDGSQSRSCWKISEIPNIGGWPYIYFQLPQSVSLKGKQLVFDVMTDGVVSPRIQIARLGEDDGTWTDLSQIWLNAGDGVWDTKTVDLSGLDISTTSMITFGLCGSSASDGHAYYIDNVRLVSTSDGTEVPEIIPDPELESDLFFNSILAYNRGFWENSEGVDTGLTLGVDIDNVYGDKSRQSWYFHADADVNRSNTVAQLKLNTFADITDCYLVFDAKYVSDSPAAQSIGIRLHNSSWGNLNDINRYVSLTAGDWNTYYVDFSSVLLSSAKTDDLRFISLYFNFAGNTGYERTVYIDNVRLVKMESSYEDWIHINQDTGPYYCNVTTSISDQYVKAEGSSASLKVTAPSDADGKFTLNTGSLAPKFSQGTLSAWFYFGDQEPNAGVQLSSSNWKASVPANFTFSEGEDGWYYGTLDTSTIMYYEEASLDGIVRLRIGFPAGYTVYIDGLMHSSYRYGYVKDWNLSLGDDIRANFNMFINPVVAEEENAYVEVTAAGAAAQVPIADAAEALQVAMAAAQMTDEIKLCVVDGNGNRGETYTYSVRQYADYVLSSTDEELVNAHDLVDAMLSYGGKAQTYFNYNLDKMADEGIEAASTEVPTAADTQMLVSGSIDGLDFYGASLVHRNKIAVRYYFTVTGDISSYNFTYGDTTLETVAKDDMYYVEIADICPQDLNKAVPLTVSDSAGNTLSLSYSPMLYIVRKYHGEASESLKALLQALYTYHTAAEAYIGA